MKKIILFLLLFCHHCYPYPAEDVYKLTGKDYFPEVKKLLAEAKKSIYVSLYIATYYPDYQKSLPNQLLGELVKAKEKGIKIKVILDQGRASSFKRQYNDLAYFYLKDAGVDVDYDISSVKLHDKLIIIDESMVIIGSHNWSSSALKKNSETSVVIKSPQLAVDFVKWVYDIQVSPRRTPPPEAKTPNVYIPYKFLIDPFVGCRLIRLHDGYILYIYFLTKWANKTLLLDYHDAAVYLGIEDNEYYGRDINRILRKLSKKYHLIKVNIKRGEPAQITLLDYRDRCNNLLIDPRKSFIVPGAFWEFNWVKRLSIPAMYFYFINLIETNLSRDPLGWWSHSQKYLYKKYHLCPRALSDGVMELNRYNLLVVEYGRLNYPFKEYLTPRYKLLPLYPWKWHEEEIEKLKEIYGSNKVEISRKWAGVVLKENNLVVIEKLINYFKQYGGALVQYAADKVAAKRIGNPKRSFVYLEGIILKYIGDIQEEKED